MLSLVDTGASRSCVSVQLINRLRSKIEPLDENETKFLYAADGKPVEVVGKVSLPINLNGLSIFVEFLVLPSLNNELIYGLDFLERSLAQINCATRTITFYDNLVGVSILTRHSTAKNLACLSFDCSIPPMSEAVIQLYTVRPTFNVSRVADSYLVQPLPAEHKQLFLLSRAVVIPLNGNVCCRVLNPTNQIIKLKKGRPMAQLEVVDETNIKAIPEGSDVKEYINTLNDNRQSEQVSTSTDNPSKILDDLGIKISNEKLSNDQRKQLENLLVKNADVFAKNLKELQGTTLHVVPGSS